LIFHLLQANFVFPQPHFGVILKEGFYQFKMQVGHWSKVMLGKKEKFLLSIFFESNKL